MNCLLAIVPRPHGQHAYEAAYAAGAPGGTLLPARVLATSSILQLLGLGDTSADLLVTVVPEAATAPVTAAIKAYAAGARIRAGIILSVPALRFLRAAPSPLALIPDLEPASQESAMTENTPAAAPVPAPDPLVVAILNKG